MESRKSPNTVPNWDTMLATCRSTSTVDLRELKNWEDGTLRHSLGRRSGGPELGAPSPELAKQHNRMAREMTMAEESLGAMEVRNMKTREDREGWKMMKERVSVFKV